MVAKAACEIDWESLPTNREIVDYSDRRVIQPPHKFRNRKVIEYVKSTMSKFDLLQTNNLEYDTNNTDTLVFNSWFEDYNIKMEKVAEIEKKAIMLKMQAVEDFEINIFGE
jgi:hypothetical protein